MKSILCYDYVLQKNPFRLNLLVALAHQAQYHSKLLILSIAVQSFNILLSKNPIMHFDL